MKVVTDALESVKQSLKDDDPVKGIHIRFGEKFGTNLRFDFEHKYSLDSKHRETVIDDMFRQIENDLTDLVVDGDIRSNDPLLKSFDGERKLSKICTNVTINSYALWSEHRVKKNTYEYTLFFNVSAEFHGATSKLNMTDSTTPGHEINGVIYGAEEDDVRPMNKDFPIG